MKSLFCLLFIGLLAEKQTLDFIVEIMGTEEKNLQSPTDMHCLIFLSIYTKDPRNPQAQKTLVYEKTFVRKQKELDLHSKTPCGETSVAYNHKFFKTYFGMISNGSTKFFSSSFDNLQENLSSTGANDPRAQEKVNCIQEFLAKKANPLEISLDCQLLLFTVPKKKKVISYKNVTHDYFDILVINKGFGEGKIKEGEKELGYWDNFLVFIFAVNQSPEVTYPFVFIDDENVPCLYAVSSGKDHLQEPVGVDVASCDHNNLEDLVHCGIVLPQQKFYLKYSNLNFKDLDQTHIRAIQIDQETIFTKSFSEDSFFYTTSQVLTNDYETYVLDDYFFSQFKFSKLRKDGFILSQIPSTRDLRVLMIPNEENNSFHAYKLEAKHYSEKPPKATIKLRKYNSFENHFIGNDVINLSVPVKYKAVVLKLEKPTGSTLEDKYNIITLNENRSFGWIFLKSQFQTLLVKEVQQVNNSDQIFLQLSEYPDLRQLKPEQQTEILVTLFPMAKSQEGQVPNYEEKLQKYKAFLQLQAQNQGQEDDEKTKGKTGSLKMPQKLIIVEYKQYKSEEKKQLEIPLTDEKLNQIQLFEGPKKLIDLSQSIVNLRKKFAKFKIPIEMEKIQEITGKYENNHLVLQLAKSSQQLI